MTYSLKQLAIMVNTITIHLTAEEQRAACEFVNAYYGDEPKYKAKKSKAAYAEGSNLRDQFPNMDGPEIGNWLRRNFNLKREYNERHPELDQ